MKKNIKSFVKDSYSAGRYPFANQYFTYPNLKLASKYIPLKSLFVMENIPGWRSVTCLASPPPPWFCYVDNIIFYSILYRFITCFFVFFLPI